MLRKENYFESSQQVRPTTFHQMFSNWPLQEMSYLYIVADLQAPSIYLHARTHTHTHTHVHIWTHVGTIFIILTVDQNIFKLEL